MRAELNINQRYRGKVSFQGLIFKDDKDVSKVIGRIKWNQLGIIFVLRLEV